MLREVDASFELETEAEEQFSSKAGGRGRGDKKIAPRGSKRLPREPREAQKASQEASKTSKRVPKNALETKMEPHQASIKQNGTAMEMK